LRIEENKFKKTHPTTTHKEEEVRDLLSMLIGFYLGFVVGSCVSMVICSITNWGKKMADEFIRNLLKIRSPKNG
jgi:hypothetical protein